MIDELLWSTSNTQLNHYYFYHHHHRRTLS